MHIHNAQKIDVSGFDRVVKLKDLDSEMAYLPVKLGEKFIIEIEGTPSSGFLWTVEDLGYRHSLEALELIECMNLDENHAGEYYNYPKGHTNKESGVYHFHFRVNNKGHTGSETINFILRKPETKVGAIEKHLYIHVDERKDEL